MSNFDPYLTLLQIPRDRRPPTAEDLLGLREGESDPGRIHEAFQERYARAQKYILSPDPSIAAEVQRVLRELAAAAPGK